MVVGPPRWLITLLIIFAVIVAVSSLTSLIFLYCFKNKPIVAMGQPVMLAILCVGALMVAMAFTFGLLIIIADPFSKSDAELNVYCSCWMWLLHIGLLTMLTILICKLYRVHKVMKFRRNQVVRPYHIFGPFVFVLLLGIGTLVATEAFYPQQYTKHMNEDGILEFGYCWSAGEGAFILEILRLVITLSVDIGILLFAYRLRHVSEEIGESRKIFFILCFSALVYAIEVIEVPFIWGRGLGEKEIFALYVATYSIVYFLQVTAIMNILILPRIYYVWYERVNGSLPENVRMFGTGQVRVNVGTPTTTAPTTTTTITLPDGGNSDCQNNLGL